MLAAVTGIRALVRRAAAGSRTTISNTKMVQPSQVKPSWNMCATASHGTFFPAKGRDKE